MEPQQLAVLFEAMVPALAAAIAAAMAGLPAASAPDNPLTRPPAAAPDPLPAPGARGTGQCDRCAGSSSSSPSWGSAPQQPGCKPCELLEAGGCLPGEGRWLDPPGAGPDAGVEWGECARPSAQGGRLRASERRHDGAHRSARPHPCGSGGGSSGAAAPASAAAAGWPQPGPWCGGSSRGERRPRSSTR